MVRFYFTVKFHVFGKNCERLRIAKRWDDSFYLKVFGMIKNKDTILVYLPVYMFNNMTNSSLIKRAVEGTLPRLYYYNKNIKTLFGTLRLLSPAVSYK